ncbi:YwaF family protein [Mycoplasmopsis hyopharyngis]|uniref:YwaF family protein n=1 Tax=Mycoplasmopsis hyopharyngis TaxID=29558 RepID=UPI003872AD54
MKSSFWNFNGTGLRNFSGPDLYFYWTFVAFALLTWVLLWVFRRIIRNNFLLKESFTTNEHNVFATWITLGLVILAFQIVRIAWVVEKSSDRIWESIPLQFCRLTLMIITILLLSNKTKYIAYITPYSTLAASLALILREIPDECGMDTYFYWDFLIIHTFILLFPMVISSLYKIEFTFVHSLIRIASLFAFTLLAFFINWITFKFAPSNWKSNYFFTGKNEINSFSSLLGKASNWPYNLFTYTFIGIIWEVIAVFIYCVQDKIFIDKIGNLWILKIQKSENYVKYFDFKKILLNKANINPEDEKYFS